MDGFVVRRKVIWTVIGGLRLIGITASMLMTYKKKDYAQQNRDDQTPRDAEPILSLPQSYKRKNELQQKLFQ